MIMITREQTAYVTLSKEQKNSSLHRDSKDTTTPEKIPCEYIQDVISIQMFYTTSIGRGRKVIY